MDVLKYFRYNFDFTNEKYIFDCCNQNIYEIAKNAGNGYLKIYQGLINNSTTKLAYDPVEYITKYHFDNATLSTNYQNFSIHTIKLSATNFNNEYFLKGDNTWGLVNNINIAVSSIGMDKLNASGSQTWAYYLRGDGV